MKIGDLPGIKEADRILGFADRIPVSKELLEDAAVTNLGQIIQDEFDYMNGTKVQPKYVPEPTEYCECCGQEIE